MSAARVDFPLPEAPTIPITMEIERERMPRACVLALARLDGEREIAQNRHIRPRRIRERHVRELDAQWLGLATDLHNRHGTSYFVIA